MPKYGLSNAMPSCSAVSFRSLGSIASGLGDLSIFNSISLLTIFFLESFISSSWESTTLFSNFGTSLMNTLLEKLDLRFLLVCFVIARTLFLWWVYCLYFSGSFVSIYLCHKRCFFFVAWNIFLSIGMPCLFFLLLVYFLARNVFFLCLH